MRRPPREAATIGLALGVIVVALSHAADAIAQPLIVVPYTLTALMFLTAPASPLTSPRAILGGYACALLTAGAIASLDLPPAVAAAAATAVAVAAAGWLGALHLPPAALALLLARRPETAPAALATIAASTALLVLATTTLRRRR